MEDCKYLKTENVTPYHGDVFDHPDYKYTCEKCGKEVIPFIHCNKDRCGDYNNQTSKDEPKTKVYKLEAYDKDNDVYNNIMVSADINLLKELGITILSNFNLSRRDNNEPIDWLIISTNDNETPICFLSDESPKNWNYYK